MSNRLVQFLSVVLCATLTVALLPSTAWASGEGGKDATSNPGAHSSVEPLRGQADSGNGAVAASSSATSAMVLDGELSSESDSEESDESSLGNAEESLEAFNPALSTQGEIGEVGSPCLLEDRALAALSGVFEFESVLSGKVLDVRGASLDSCAAIQAYEGNGTPAQRYRLEEAGDGLYYIVNVASEKVLDVANGSWTPGTTIQQYDRNGSAAQKWAFVPVEGREGAYYIMSALSRDLGGSSGQTLVLDVANASVENGARVQLYTFNASAAQMFEASKVDRVIDDGVYAVRSALGADLVLDVASGSFLDGGNIQVYSSNMSAAQKFEVRYDESSGYYSVRNANSGCMLDIANGSSDAGANVQQYQDNGTWAQRWSFEAVGEGCFAVRSAYSGLVLDVSDGQASPGANVQVWVSNGSAAQGWQFERTLLLNEGVFEVGCGSEKVLDAENGGVENGTNVRVYQRNGSMAQKYRIAYVGDGCYQLECVKSGLVLDVENGSGPNVQLYQNNGTAAQLWKPSIAGNGQFTFENKGHAGMFLEVSADGSNVQIGSEGAAVFQEWSLIETDDFVAGTYTVHSALQNGMVLDIRDGSVESGAVTQLYQDNGTTAQMFGIEAASNGAWRIKSIKSGLYIEVRNGAIGSDGSGVVQQGEFADDVRQLWRIRYAGSGRFEVFAVCSSDESCLDVSQGVAANGTGVALYQNNGTLAQQWGFVPAVVPEPEPEPGPSDGAVSYAHYALTLDQMADLQMDNPYITASRDEVRQCLDPTQSDSKYQFMDLRTTSGVSGSMLDSYIDSTLQGRSGMLHGMGYAFVQAAEAYGLNEVYLLSHAILESGWGTSTLAQGYYYDGTVAIEGTYYPAGTYYNFYGIGAYDSSPLSGGRSLAIQNGWNTPEKAIVGAAQWISENYTYLSRYSQPTLYDMKWDVKRSNDTFARGWHQYATDIYWARSIADIMEECFDHSGGGSGVSYIVPVYQDEGRASSARLLCGAPLFDRVQ